MPPAPRVAVNVVHRGMGSIWVGGDIDRLPLPVDVGQALVDYLRHGRADTSSRAVFVRARAPFTAMAPSSLSCVVARAARRAGLGTVHAA
jgi:integrase/recombinase XerD